jgi:hypothetical protein
VGGRERDRNGACQTTETTTPSVTTTSTTTTTTTTTTNNQNHNQQQHRRRRHHHRHHPDHHYHPHHHRHHNHHHDFAKSSDRHLGTRILSRHCSSHRPRRPAQHRAIVAPFVAVPIAINVIISSSSSAVALWCASAGAEFPVGAAAQRWWRPGRVRAGAHARGVSTASGGCGGAGNAWGVSAACAPTTRWSMALSLVLHLCAMPSWHGRWGCGRRREVLGHTDISPE